MGTASGARISTTGSVNRQNANVSTFARASARPKSCNARSRSISSICRWIHPMLSQSIGARRADVQRLPKKLAWPIGANVFSSDAVPFHFLVEALVVE
jgi:hypothetical protein